MAIYMWRSVGFELQPTSGFFSDSKQANAGDEQLLYSGTIVANVVYEKLKIL
jgi:hypothetical protein